MYLYIQVLWLSPCIEFWFLLMNSYVPLWCLYFVLVCLYSVTICLYSVSVCFYTCILIISCLCYVYLMFVLYTTLMFLSVFCLSYVCILCPYAFNLYRFYLMFVLCSYQILITPLVSSNSSYVCIWLSSLFCCLNSLSMLCVAFCISNFLFALNTFSILYHMYVKLSWAFPVFSVIETCTYTHTSRAGYIPWYVVL